MKSIESMSLSDIQEHLKERLTAERKADTAFIKGIARQAYAYAEGDPDKVYALLSGVLAELLFGKNSLKSAEHLRRKLGLD